MRPAKTQYGKRYELSQGTLSNCGTHKLRSEFGTDIMDRGIDSNSLATSDLHELRRILLGDYQARLESLELKLKEAETELEQLRSVSIDKEQSLQREIDRLIADSAEKELGIQTEISQIRGEIIDKEAILEVVQSEIPVFVKTSIDESKDEMIDAIHPIMGSLITRSVSESMRELARNIDERMRSTFDFSMLTQRLKARATGVSDAEMAIRQALPFRVDELFLVHIDTGILLQYLAREFDRAKQTDVFVTKSDDSEVVSGMLTAFQDFVEDAFGQGTAGSLDEFQYGQRQVHIKPGRHVYLAVVIQGIAPRGFSREVQDLVYKIEGQYASDLRDFDGEISVFDTVRVLLQSIMDE